jgi:hypothetical protein
MKSIAKYINLLLQIHMPSGSFEKKDSLLSLSSNVQQIRNNAIMKYMKFQKVLMVNQANLLIHQVIGNSP